MSGICGIWSARDAVSAGDLDAMLGALHGWGEEPGRFTAAGAGVALGARLMRVTPEDAYERQPLCSADGQVALVADARLDNRDELRAALGLSAERARVMPDSAFILAAWQAWGDACAARLIGDFAFILWDAGRRQFFCLRDAVGQRVLYFHRSADRVAVASSPRALAALPFVAVRLNEQKVADFLYQIEDPSSTYFQDVERLPPGHALRADPGGVRIQQVRAVDTTRRIRLGSDGEYLEAFREVFGRAVQARVRASGDVGVMMSAGLDSSAVAAVAAERLSAEGRRLRAYHAAPPEGFRGETRPGWVADESDEARSIAAMHPNMDLTIHRTGNDDAFDAMDALFDVAAMPVRNPSNLAWVLAIYALAQADGAHVLLNGQKGNATISYTGLRSLRELLPAFPLRLLREVRAFAGARGRPARQVLKHQVIQPLLPLALLRLYARLRGNPGTPSWYEDDCAIRPEFARELRMEERLRERRWSDEQMDRSTATEYRHYVLTSNADAADAPHALRARFGIETRDPTSDLRVIEFCFGIPGTMYLSDGVERQLVRRGLRGSLPDAVLDRTTRGAQSADLLTWLPPLRDRLRAELDALDRSEAARRCLDLPHMRELVDRWPAPFRLEHRQDYDHYLLRGILMGRFLRWFESRAAA